MRHRKKGRKLNRSSAHRSAMVASMAASLIEHERVITTPQKAKEVKRFVERLITMARKGGLARRRKAHALLKQRVISALNDKGNYTSTAAIKKLFGELAERFRDRNGGYTRIVRLGGSRRGDGPLELKYRLKDESRTLRLTGKRLGDSAEQVILEFVDIEESIQAQEVEINQEEEGEEEE